MNLDLEKSIDISFVIATCNRPFYLQLCIDSFCNQNQELFDYEIIIIDNSGNNNTKAIVEKCQFVYSRIIYKVENRLGRSLARNRGISTAKGEWIVFIDDDAQLQSNYFARLKFLVDSFDFDCFGGMYYPVYFEAKPKWISPNFGKKVLLKNELGEITNPWLSLGNMAVKKEVFTEIGYFNTQFGGNEKIIAFGEENDFQKRLLEIGGKIGFDPELKVDHAVLPHKFKLSWHLKSWYAHGRDGQRWEMKYSFGKVLLQFLRSLFGGLIKLPIVLVKLIFNKDYYWQNMVWDFASPVYYRLGQIKAFFY